MMANQQLITKDDPAESGAMVVRPQQTMVTAESSRVQAEIQASMLIARANPRDERNSVARIEVSCQRPRLAELSQYEYSKGGQKITGPSIRLLECVASHWGNLTYGFREISNSGGESTVESFAWDLETNTKATRQFTVPHKIKSGSAMKPLTDPRDIYELVANQAQRRVRSCLEEVIPRDIIDDAVDHCNETLKAKCDTSPEAVKKMVEAFNKEFGVTKDQIEARLQRNISSISPAQFLSMKRIFMSIRDGMSDVKDWFKPIEVEADVKSKPDLKDKLKGKKAEPTTPAKSEPAKDEKPKADQQKLMTAYRDLMQKTTSVPVLEKIAADIEADHLFDDESRKQMLAEVKEMIDLAGQ